MKLSGFIIAIIGFGLTIGSYAHAQMRLTTNSMTIGAKMPASAVYNHVCNGGNISPDLNWQGAPKSTKSFAIIMFDPDAPYRNNIKIRGWWHWLVYNIPSSVHNLPKGANLKTIGAAQGINDFNEYNYSGACPPKGDSPHRYIFTIYALDVEKLEVVPKASPITITRAIAKHTIAKAAFTVTYSH